MSISHPRQTCVDELGNITHTRKTCNSSRSSFRIGLICPDEIARELAGAGLSDVCSLVTTKVVSMKNQRVHICSIRCIPFHIPGILVLVVHIKTHPIGGGVHYANVLIELYSIS